ncbi:hypothetical protein [Streptomyces sp. NBC_01174]|nr:hypothetical protein OG414_40815 [Streptomyces sp. NBC_01174]
MRLAIVGTAHLQARQLGLELGSRSIDILARAQSTGAVYRKC